MMLIRLLFFTVLLICICSQVVEAQWKAICYKEAITDTAYDIRDDKSFPLTKGFIFPEYFYYDNINALKGGVECASWGPLLAWCKSFGENITFKKDSAAVFLRLYTENIKQYTYWLFCARKHKWRKKEVTLPFGGYQIPTTELLTEWPAADTPITLPVKVGMDLGDQLLISVIPIDAQRPWKLMIGDLAIGTLRRSAYTVTHPFFSTLMASAGERPDAAMPVSYPVLHSDYFKKIPEGMDDYSLSSRIDILPDGTIADSADSRLLLRKIIESGLEYYPFYKERRLDKASVIKNVRGIFNSPRNSAYCSLVDSLARYIRYTFNDLHFYIDYLKGPCKPPTEERQKSPVRIIQIGDRFLIGAKFDSVYSMIAINDELIAIDNKPVQKVLDSMATRLYGSTYITAYEKYSITGSLLDRSRDDSCKLRTRSASSSATSETVVRYNKNYTIPDNFRPIHAEYRRYDDVVYFRVNYWEEAVYLRFINHWDDIRTANKIIIDLRGNGGGELMSAMQLFSIFIKSPQIYFWNIDEKGMEKPVTILPDKSFSFPSPKKVIILGDQTTACASETFIKAMQSRGNAWYIGAGNTAGSLAAKFDIRLPSGIVVHVNSLQKKVYYQPRRYVIENRGIEPDVLIKISRVEDLRPYNDKLLKEAIKMLSADNRGIAENRKKSRQ